MNACFLDYIGIDRNSTSRSSLYAVDLPGVVLATLGELTTEDQADYLEFWEVVYGRAVSNLITDVSTSLQTKFHVDSKLLTRETSEFTETTTTVNDYAGILIDFNLPKYARIHIISAEVKIVTPPSEPDPEVRIAIFPSDDPGVAGGNAIFNEFFTFPGQGLLTCHIDFDVESDQVFIAYIPNEVVINTGANIVQTENKEFNSNLVNDKLSCESCFGDGLYTGTITQVNGGGLNVRYVIYCSIEKFVCENINLFKKALWWKVGEEIAVEQIFGERINRFTTMSAEGADKRMAFFNAQFTKELNEAIKSQNIPEDLVCFRCKNVVEAVSSIP